MKKFLTLTSGLLCLTASMAAAQPTFLEWDECLSGVVDKSFACNSNAGTNTMVSSFLAPANLQCMVSASFELVIASSNSGFPLWWRTETGGCRQGALFSDDAGGLGLAGCNNPFDGGTNLTLSQVDANYGGNPNRARAQGDLARTDCAPAIAAGSRNIGNAITLRNTKSTGTGNCAGCTAPMCIVLTRQTVEQPAGTPPAARFDMVTNPPATSIPYVTWQGGAISDPAGCPGATPARKTSWGNVKALYR